MHDLEQGLELWRGLVAGEDDLLFATLQEVGGGDEHRGGGSRDTYYDEGLSAGSRGARGYDNDRSGYRRDGREHSDRYRDEYEDSERGDDELFHRADNVSVLGIID